MALGSQVHGEDAGEQVGVVHPAAGDLGGDGRGRPGVHHAGGAGEPSRPVTVGQQVAAGHVGGRVDRQPGLVGDQRVLVVDGAVGAHPVPQRERHPEEALAADAPVGREPVDPVLEPAAHPLGMPGQLAPPGQEGVLEADGADEPLAAGQDLHRLAAVLVELDRLGDPGRGRGQRAGLAQHGPHPLPGPADGQTGELVVGPLGGRRVGAPEPGRAPDHRPDGPVGVQHRPHGQAQLAPPHQVGRVAEGAEHGDAGPLGRLGQAVGQHRHLGPEQRGAHGRPQQAGEAAVVGVDDQGHTGGQQLRPGRLDLDTLAEPHPVGHALDLAVLQLGLGDGGVEVDLPQGGGVGLVGQALGQQAQERPLGGPPGLLADGGIGQRPVDRQPQPAEDGLEGLLVLHGELAAELHEVGPDTAIGWRDGHSGGSKAGL